MSKYPFKIIVDSQELKDLIIKESKYVHDLWDIDSDRASFLMHLYRCEDAIIVKE